MSTDPERGFADSAGEEEHTHSYSLSLSDSPDAHSPAAAALDEAIDASVEGRRLFPNGAMFINGDEPYIGRAMRVQSRTVPSSSASAMAAAHIAAGFAGVSVTYSSS